MMAVDWSQSWHIWLGGCWDRYNFEFAHLGDPLVSYNSGNFRSSDISQYLKLAKLALDGLLICLRDTGSDGTEFQQALVEKSSWVGSPPSPPPLPITPISPPILGQIEHPLA